MRGAAILFAVALGCLATTRPAAASEAQELALARDQRSLLAIPAGESVTLFGLQYTAQETATVYATLSSEFVGVAVIAGRVSAAGTVATAGEVLVTPIERQRTMRYIFDGAALARSLDDAQAAQIGAQLAILIAEQRQQRFWGRLEPVGINLRAPGSALIETIRSQYLGEPAIVAIRAEAQGDTERRRLLTAARFAAAIRAGDAATVAALLDPMPFTEVSRDPAVWRAARTAFAQRIVADGAIQAATAGAAPPAQVDPLAFALGDAFTLRLVDRDRATFITGLEPNP